MHRFRFSTCVRASKIAACLSHCSRIHYSAGIIEGANDGRGRGRQGKFALKVQRIAIRKLLNYSDCWWVYSYLCLPTLVTKQSVIVSRPNVQPHLHRSRRPQTPQRQKDHRNRIRRLWYPTQQKAPKHHSEKEGQGWHCNNEYGPSHEHRSRRDKGYFE